MENVVFAILMLGCDHSLDRCTYVPTPVEHYVTREQCDDVLTLAFHEAEGYPVAVGECVGIPDKWIEKDVALEWVIDGGGRLKVAIVGPDNEVFGDAVAIEVASRTRRIGPAG